MPLTCHRTPQPLAHTAFSPWCRASSPRQVLLTRGGVRTPRGGPPRSSSSTGPSDITASAAQARGLTLNSASTAPLQSFPPPSSPSRVPVLSLSSRPLRTQGPWRVTHTDPHLLCGAEGGGGASSLGGRRARPQRSCCVLGLRRLQDSGGVRVGSGVFLCASDARALSVHGRTATGPPTTRNPDLPRAPQDHHLASPTLPPPL